MWSMVVLKVLLQVQLKLHVFVPTRRCPACGSGMEAPGIRHNKECKKRFGEFEKERRKERRVEVEDVRPTPVVVHQMPVPSPEPIEVEMEASPGSVPPSLRLKVLFRLGPTSSNQRHRLST